MPEAGTTSYRGIPITATLTKTGDREESIEHWTVEIGPTAHGSTFSKSLMDESTADGFIAEIKNVIDKSLEG